MRPFEVRDLGQMGYREALAIQRETLERVADGHSPDTLLFVEHPPVLTLGTNFHAENLLMPLDAYRARGIEVIETDRGGDVTYHGPGQLVIYPIFDVAARGKDLHRWLRELEQVLIDAVGSYGIAGERFPPNTGCWVRGHKIAAIGIRVRRWVSMHGMALNCNNDLGVFDLFVPCGIRSHGVTSLSHELGREVDPRSAQSFVVGAFTKTLGKQ